MKSIFGKNIYPWAQIGQKLRMHRKLSRPNRYFEDRSEMIKNTIVYIITWLNFPQQPKDKSLRKRYN